jgi:MFS superfamily sulfate permease-like transporter
MGPSVNKVLLLIANPHVHFIPQALVVAFIIIARWLVAYIHLVATVSLAKLNFIIQGQPYRA